MYQFILQNKRLGELKIRADPEGWDDLNYTFKRSKVYRGLFWEVTLNLAFFKDARRYLQSAYEFGGVDEKVLIFIKQRIPAEYRFEEFYDGIIDFSKYGITETKLKVNIQQSGPHRQFFNLDNVAISSRKLKTFNGTVLIPSANEQITLPLPGKAIPKVYEAHATPLIRFDLTVASSQFFGTIGWDILDTSELTIAFLSLPGITTTDPIVDENFWFQADEDFTGEFDISIVWNLGIDCSSCSPLDFINTTLDAAWTLHHYDEENNLKTIYVLSNPVVNKEIFFGFRIQVIDPDTGEVLNEFLPGVRNVTSEVNVPKVFAKKGDRFYLILDITHTQGGVSTLVRLEHNSEASKVKITGLTTAPATTAEAVPVYEMLERMAQYMMDKQDAFRSNFFGRTDSSKPYTTDGPGSLQVILSGLNIRGFDDRAVTDDWENLFGALNIKHMLGAGIEKNEVGEEVIVVEDLKHFFSDTVILDLGCVDKIEKKIRADLYYNEIEVGYPRPKLENTGVLADEFNSIRKYTLPVAAIKRKLNLVSKIKGSGYEIETLRRKSEESTTDNERDDINFWINVVRKNGGFEVHSDQGFSILDNVLDPGSVMNVLSAPERMLDAWGPFIKAFLLKVLDRSIEFASGSDNTEMRSQRSTGDPKVIEAGVDIDPKSLGDPIWEPEVYLATAILTREQVNVIKNNPTGLIKIEDRLGTKMQGWIEVAKVAPNTNGAEVDFELLKKFDGEKVFAEKAAFKFDGSLLDLWGNYSSLNILQMGVVDSGGFKLRVTIKTYIWSWKAVYFAYKNKVLELQTALDTVDSIGVTTVRTFGAVDSASDEFWAVLDDITNPGQDRFMAIKFLGNLHVEAPNLVEGYVVKDKNDLPQEIINYINNFT